MNGTIIALPCGAGGIVTPIDGPPTLEYLQAAVDGLDVEMVPGFKTIEYAETVVDCIAFADQDAKVKGKLINRDASVSVGRGLTARRLPGADQDRWVDRRYGVGTSRCGIRRRRIHGRVESTSRQPGFVA